MATTFSSAHMRETVRLLEEKHRAELDIAERKLGRLKRVIDDADKQAFDLRNRAHQLAQSLGFSDITEAQRAFDVADHEVTFRQAFERVQVLEDEARRTRKQDEGLQDRCRELEEFLEIERKRSAALEKDGQRCQQELSDLTVQYDALLDRSRRAQERYICDRRKFYDIYDWLCVEPLPRPKNPKQGHQFDLQNQNTQHRRAILREFGPNLSKLLGLDSAALDRMMRAAQGAAPAEDCQIVDPSDVIDPQMTSLTPDIGLNGASGRRPLFTLPANYTVKPGFAGSEKQVKDLLQSPLNAKSSDTEEDSQAPSQFFNVPLPPDPPLNVRLASSSDTEDDSQASRLFPSSPDIPPATTPFSAMRPTAKRLMYAQLPSRPSFNPSRSTLDTASLHFHVKSEPEDDTGNINKEHPAKKPRLSLGLIIQTPKSKADLVPRRVFSTGRMTKERKPYADENTPLESATPVARTSGQTRMEDYTTYKGRGRYGKEAEPARKTINATFSINPARNGGFSHQYEEVIRDKGERMRMNAGDCEDCRDWYTAIGPLPPRDRGPLWRSPSTTPVKRCKHHVADHSPDRDISPSPSVRNQEEIDIHKRQISRHRQNWARAQTPPGYWNIGFPSTQEAKDINEKAEEIHQRKFRKVEREAEEGRWTRK